MVRGPWVSQNELVVVPLRLLFREAAVVVVGGVVVVVVTNRVPTQNLRTVVGFDLLFF